MKKVLFVLTSADELAGQDTGYQLSEAAHPWKVFRDAGVAVDFASIRGGTPTPNPDEQPDAIVEEFTADETVNAQMLNTPALENVDAAGYDAVYLVGGHGTMVDFPGSAALKRLVADVTRAGGIVGAVCHGPAGLLDVALDNGLSLLDGKQVTGFSDAEEDKVGKSDVVPFSLQQQLTAQAGSYTCADPFDEHVVVDGTLITGQNPASAAGVAKETVKLLAEAAHAEHVAEEQAAAALRAEKDAAKEDDAAAS